MARTVVPFAGVLFAAIVAAFALGWWLRGEVAGPASEARTHKEAPAPQPAAAPAEPRTAMPDPVELIERGARPPRVLDRLEALEHELAYEAHVALRARVLDAAEAMLEQRRVEEATALLEAYCERWVHDGRAHLLLADLYQMGGRTEAALAALYEVLSYPEDATQAQRARDRIGLLERSHAQLLAQRREFEQLVEFYERLLNLDPLNDGYRIAAAEWLIAAGDEDEALAQLSQVTADLDGRAARLTQRASLSASGVNTWTDGDRLLARIRVGGEEMVLLVDTGATMTSLERPAIARTGGKRVNDGVWVTTATGRVAVPVYEITSLEVGDVRIDSLSVLGLPQDLPGVDGLLGMDLLRRVGLPALPGEPASEPVDNLERTR